MATVKKKKSEHRDFFGTIINPGDYVVAAKRNYFNCYKVLKLCNLKVRVLNADKEPCKWDTGDLRNSEDLIVMEPAAVTFRKLSRKK